jgi:DNA-binding Xre family transcriptional regulator
MIDKNKTVSDIVKKSGILQSTLSRSLQKADNDYRINYMNQIIQALDCTIQIQIIDNNTNDILYTITDTNTD